MIKVSNLQRGNRLLDFLNKASWHYDASISADYDVGFNISILFLSLKFHASKPEYIYKRIKKLKPKKLQVVLILLDTPNYNTILEELFDRLEFKIILCKSYDECSRYLRGFDISSKRSSDILRKKKSTADSFLEAFPKINKSNSTIIQSSYENIQELFKKSQNELAKLFNVGKEKAESLYIYIHKPFKWILCWF